MPAVQRQTSLMHEVARFLQGLGNAIRNMLPAEPVPYWTDYLHQEREKNR
jgi:hypothetical protein